jgi:hypothetical protein
MEEKELKIYGRCILGEEGFIDKTSSINPLKTASYLHRRVAPIGDGDWGEWAKETRRRDKKLIP